jgi:hypothetical protein
MDSVALPFQFWGYLAGIANYSIQDSQLSCKHIVIQAYLMGTSLRQTTEFTPRVHRWEIVSRRWCRRLCNSVDNDNVLFLEARLEVTSQRARIVLDKQYSFRAAHLSI